jgi:transposase-like protein
VRGEAPLRDERSARRALETLRWSDGLFCPTCGSSGRDAIKRADAKSGVYKCGGCRLQFTVTTGTRLHKSKIPLHVWWRAAYLYCQHPDLSATELSRELKLAYKTAWFMLRRLQTTFKDA